MFEHLMCATLTSFGMCTYKEIVALSELKASSTAEVPNRGYSYPLGVQD